MNSNYGNYKSILSKGSNTRILTRLRVKRLNFNAQTCYVKQSDIDEVRYHELICKMANSNEFISRADVVQLLHIPEDKAYRLLKELVEQDHLVLVQKGRYAKYAAKS